MHMRQWRRYVLTEMLQETDVDTSVGNGRNQANNKHVGAPSRHISKVGRSFPLSSILILTLSDTNQVRSILAQTMHRQLHYVLMC